MKKLIFLAVMLMILPCFLVSCGKQDRLNQYFITATFNDSEKTLACHEEVKFVNNTPNALNEVCFFTYANAFDEGQKPVSTSTESKAYPNGKSFGSIEIESVKNGENDAEFSQTPNILTVKLDDTLFPDEDVLISIDFCVRLANIRHRLGFNDNTINFGNFFPIACVYENGFVKNEFSPSGDPFYSDVSDFSVEINFPSKYQIAFTGEGEVKENSETKTASVNAKKVRDFCFVLSDKFEVISANAGNVKVNYFYYDDENAEENLQTSVKAVETFCELFGQYPYKILNVVKAGFCFGGMEYPNLVLIADDIAEVDYVIVHEIAHQWWYGVVGNNEFENAWVDEGLTEYSTAMFYEKNSEYGLEMDVIMENAISTYTNFVSVYKKINGACDESMNRTLNEFLTEPEYVNCTYTKGMLLFDAVRLSMSEKKFLQCLQDYYKKYAFKNSSAEKLISSFSKTSHVNLEKLFESWTSGEVAIKTV